MEWNPFDTAAFMRRYQNAGQPSQGSSPSNNASSPASSPERARGAELGALQGFADLGLAGRESHGSSGGMAPRKSNSLLGRLMGRPAGSGDPADSHRATGSGKPSRIFFKPGKSKQDIPREDENLIEAFKMSFNGNSSTLKGHVRGLKHLSMALHANDRAAIAGRLEDSGLDEDLEAYLDTAEIKKRARAALREVRQLYGVTEVERPAVVPRKYVNAFPADVAVIDDFQKNFDGEQSTGRGYANCLRAFSDWLAQSHLEGFSHRLQTPGLDLDLQAFRKAGGDKNTGPALAALQAGGKTTRRKLIPSPGDEELIKRFEDAPGKKIKSTSIPAYATALRELSHELRIRNLPGIDGRWNTAEFERNLNAVILETKNNRIKKAVQILRSLNLEDRAEPSGSQSNWSWIDRIERVPGAEDLFGYPDGFAPPQPSSSVRSDSGWWNELGTLPGVEEVGSALLPEVGQSSHAGYGAAPAFRSPIPRFDADDAGPNWQHGPQLAPDWLVERGAHDEQIVEICGLEYRVAWTQTPWNEWRLGLYPRQRGG